MNVAELLARDVERVTGFREVYSRPMTDATRVRLLEQMGLDVRHVRHARRGEAWPVLLEEELGLLAGDYLAGRIDVFEFVAAVDALEDPAA